MSSSVIDKEGEAMQESFRVNAGGAYEFGEYTGGSDMLD